MKVSFEDSLLNWLVFVKLTHIYNQLKHDFNVLKV